MLYSINITDLYNRRDRTSIAIVEKLKTTAAILGRLPKEYNSVTCTERKLVEL